MKRLVKLINSYPDIDIKEDEVIFSKPIYDNSKKAIKVNVTSALSANTYIDKDIYYQKVNLNSKDYLDKPIIKVIKETKLSELLDKLNDTFKFSYQVDIEGIVSDNIIELTKEDIVDLDISSLVTDSVVKVKASKDSFVFTGELHFKILKEDILPAISFDIVPVLIKR